MPLLDRSNMVDGNIIPASDVYQIVKAFTYEGNYDLLISGSVSVGTGSIQSDAKFYIKQNLKVDGGITGSVSGSFTGDGTNIRNIISSSYALTASYVSGGLSNTVYNDFTSSYFIDSASFHTKIDNLELSGSKYTLTSSFNSFSSSYNIDSASFDTRIIAALSPYRIISGSTTVTTYPNGNVIITSGSTNDVQLIVSGSGSFTGEVIAPSFNQTSLRALKENVYPFSASAVDIIKSIDVVSFNFKENKSSFKIGIIADDTHEYVSSKQKNKLDITNSIGILFKAIQELNDKIDALRK